MDSAYVLIIDCPFLHVTEELLNKEIWLILLSKIMIWGHSFMKSAKKSNTWNPCPPYSQPTTIQLGRLDKLNESRALLK